MNSVRWNIAVSKETDQAVRMFLAAHSGDLSSLVQEAVRAYLFRYEVNQAKTAAAKIDEDELSNLIEEAVQWSRK